MATAKQLSLTTPVIDALNNKYLKVSEEYYRLSPDALYADHRKHLMAYLITICTEAADAWEEVGDVTLTMHWHFMEDTWLKTKAIHDEAVVLN